MKRFARFPLELYKNNPYYVPALVSDEIKSILDSPSMQYCSRKIWIAVTEQQGCRRVVGIINPVPMNYTTTKGYVWLV